MCNDYETGMAFSVSVKKKCVVTASTGKTIASLPVYKKSSLFGYACVADKSYYVAVVENQSRPVRICNIIVREASPGQRECNVNNR